MQNPLKSNGINDQFNIKLFKIGLGKMAKKIFKKKLDDGEKEEEAATDIDYTQGQIKTCRVK